MDKPDIIEIHVEAKREAILAFANHYMNLPKSDRGIAMKVARNGNLGALEAYLAKYASDLKKQIG